MVHRDSDRDFFMSSDEAKEYGLVDEIIQGRPKSTGDGSSPRGVGVGGGRPARSEPADGPEAGGGAAAR